MSVVIAICSLYRCFPSGIDVETTLKRGYLHTFDLTLGYPAQTINVALDLSSSNFWVFGQDSVNHSLNTQFKGGIFDLSATTQLYIPPDPNIKTTKHQQWVYEDEFEVTTQEVRTSLNIGNVSLGIPYIGINKNLTKLTKFTIQSSGLFGIQRNMYANSITMQATVDSLLTLYTARFPKTKGRLITGNLTIPECGSKFMSYKLAGASTNLTSYFSFASPQQDSTKMVISTTTSFITVDSKTYKVLEKELEPVVLDRKKEPAKNRPDRRHKLVKCSSVRKAPIIKIGDPNIGLMKISGEDYIKKTRTGYCIFKVREQTNKDQHWILGYPFLKNYCIRIDLYGQRIGFATKK